jgi:DNA polymerase III delta subunit
MVADELHNVVRAQLGDVDPTIGLEDFSMDDSSEANNVAQRVLDALATPPFLVERRVVVLREAQQLNASQVTHFISYAQAPTPGVIFVAGITGRSDKLAKACDEVISVAAGNYKERDAYVAKKFDEYGVVSDAATIHKVAETIGEDVSRVDQVARTLQAIYDSEPVKWSDVEPYVGDEGSVVPWDLTTAIDRGQTQKAILTARRMLDSRDKKGLQIVNQLKNHYTQRAAIGGLEAPNTEEVMARTEISSPTAANNFVRYSPNLNGKALVQAMKWITQADLDLKGGVDYGSNDLVTEQSKTDVTVIEVLVARLSRLALASRR